MSFEATKEQRAAIDARGRMIVSASAGSGKTAVMIERLVSLILDGADVREMLALTYTRKAAAQMREKLRTALIGRISQTENPDDRKRLKEQLTALSAADICTMHVFCARLIRSYFYLIDVNPDFRIVSQDDAEAKTYSARALNETFESAYEADGEEFRELLSVYYRKKSDKLLRETVLLLHGKVIGRTDREDFLRQVGTKDDFDGICAYLQADFAARARACYDCAEECKAVFSENSPSAYRVAEAVSNAADALLQAEDLFAMIACEETAIPRMPPMSKAKDPVNLRALKNASATVKQIYKELKEFADRDTEHARYEEARRRAEMLAKLVSDYDERLSALKREAGVLSYEDLEQCALKILRQSEARTAVLNRYRYLFVDEYQDVNAVQEQLLELLGGEEVFYVGDAKQAIYAFRGSKSEFFLEKENAFGQSFRLSESFRSAPAVLEAVNRIFSHAMTKESCGVDYRNTARMAGGSRYGMHEGEVQLHFLPKPEKAERRTRGVYSVLTESAPKADEEVNRIAGLIEKEVREGTYFDADEGIERPVDYGDIAVLVRKKSGLAEKLILELGARNIPVSGSAESNVCSYWEAKLLIDWLSYLDNPEQDIPRASAMLSFVGGFSEGELAAIRERFLSAETFRGACKAYRDKMQNELSQKLNTFEELTERYRTLACVKTAAEMMNRLLADGLEAEIAAKQDGEVRLMRVRRLIGFAQGNVNAFLQQLKATGEKVKFSEGGGEHAVKIVTMHASKGLEYPVVILGNMDTSFHGADTDEVLYTDRFAFAPKSFDTERKVIYPNVLRRACALQQKREEVKGELNLLYVAMTRAKYRLHIVLKDQEEAAVLPQYATSFSQFFDLADCRHYAAEWDGTYAEPLPRQTFVYRADEELTKRVLSVYRRPYPFEESTALPVKSSATELLKAEKQEKVLPPFVSASSSSVEEGIAYHAFLQYVRFGQDVTKELVRMAESGLLSKEQIAILKAERLEGILSLPSLKGLENKFTWREQTFLLRLTAREIGLGESDDTIVLQGAIDLLVSDESGYTVLDYKYSVRSDEEIKKTYAPQIAIYRRAVAKVMGVSPEKVRARILNILQLREIEV